jgi:DNA topoisomerase IB
MAVTTTKPPRIRLRRSDVTMPGLARRRRGRGWQYLEPDGEPVTDDEILARIAELAIPPAWKDVWICPYPGGHIQATGIDAAGRKQYLYHPRWRERRDQEKFDEMLDFARALPKMRERVARDLEDRDDFGAERVLACAVRLLDRGFFRIGSEDYAVTNDTYGLATMRKDHVALSGETIRFDYPAKHGKRRVQAVVDPEVAVVIATLKRRRSGGDELLACRRGRRWVDVKSPDINAYIKEATGADFSAKDFRTWGATVLAAVANIRLFTLAFRVLTASEVATRQLLLGAMVAGVGWQVVQILGTYLVTHSLKGSQEAYGVFGLVLGLIAWIYLLALVTVVATEINAVARDGCGRGRC